MINKWNDKDVEQYSQYDDSELDIIHPELFRMLGDVYQKKVVDYGCGEGKFLEELISRKVKVYGYDISSVMISCAKERIADKGVLEVIESGKIPLPDNSINAVVSNLVLMMCPDYGMLEQIYKEASRVLVNNGSWIFCITHPAFIDREFTLFRSVFNKEFNYSEIGQPYQFVLRKKDGNEITKESFVDYHYPLATYINLLPEMGFKLEDFNELTVKDNPLPLYVIIKGIKEHSLTQTRNNKDYH